MVEFKPAANPRSNPTPAAPFDPESPLHLASLNVASFLSQLGAKSPTPGGGAVAALTGATAAALARMVVSYSLGKKNLADHQPTLQNADAALQRFEALMLGLADEDASAYALVNTLQKLPDTDPKRLADLPAAQAAAIAVPRAVLGACCDLLRTIEALATITNRHLRSDLAIAAVLAEAGAKSAAWNVRVNLTDQTPRADQITTEAHDLLADAAGRRTWVEDHCA